VRRIWVGLLWVAIACGPVATGVETSPGGGEPNVTITATLDSARFVVREHMVFPGTSCGTVDNETISLRL